MKKRIMTMGIACIALLTAYGSYSLVDYDKVLNGVTLQNQDLSRKSESNVREIVSALVDNIQKTKKIILIDSQQKKYELNFDDLGIKGNIDDTVNGIMKLGHEGNAIENTWSAFLSYWQAREAHIVFAINEPVFDTKLLEFEKSLVQGGKNASLKVENGKVILVPAVVGQRIDFNKLKSLIKERLKKNDFSELSIPINEKAEPEITDKDLEGIDSILGSYTTYYNAGALSRTNNINIAAVKVHQKLLKSGEQLSFNTIVGERTAEAGYDDAPVFVDGKLVPGIGGGICQVSSTLYAAALYSGMSIVERTPHYAPVGYTELGLDATVSYGTLDFIFQNSLPRSVYTYVENGNGVITVYILGHSVDKPTSISVYSTGNSVVPHETIEKIDPQVKEELIDEGHDGVSLTTIREITYGDQRSIHDSFSSYYDPKPTLIVRAKKVEKKKEIEDLTKKGVEKKSESVTGKKDMKKSFEQSGNSPELENKTMAKEHETNNVDVKRSKESRR